MNKDGFVGVMVEDKQLAVRILNTIIATLLLHNIQSLAVREIEIGDVDIDSQTMTMVGSTIPLTSLRNLATRRTMSVRSEN